MTQPEPDRGDVDTDDVLRRPEYDPEAEAGTADPGSPEQRGTDAAEAPPSGAPTAPDIGRGTPEAPD